MASSPIVTCSPVAAMTSSSRGSGSGDISLASASRRFVSPLIADTTTTRRCPSRWYRATRFATFRIRSVLPTEVPPYFWTISATVASELAERDGRVGPAEAEGIGQCSANLHPTRRVRHEVEIAARILLEQVRCRQCDLIADREHGEDPFNRRRGTQQMTRHRLGRRHSELCGMLAETALQGDALGHVAERGRRAVRVDVVDVG